MEYQLTPFNMKIKYSTCVVILNVLMVKTRQ